MSNLPATLPTSVIIRRVILGQMLFSAGHALTTGGFLNYFANPFFKGFTVWLAVMQVVPEAAESLALITRWLVIRWGGRKTVWWVSLSLGRLAALAIPGLVYAGMEPGTTGAMSAIIGLLGAWYLLQGVSYTAYLSWLSDLVPEVNWGRLLARRSMAISVVTLCMTYNAAAIFERFKLLTAAEKLSGYTVLFAVGGALCLASILPVIGLPGVVMRSPGKAKNDGDAECQALAPSPQPSPPQSSPTTSSLRMGGRGRQEAESGSLAAAAVPTLWSSIGPQVRRAFSDPTFRRFLFGCWQLSFFQGLTQTAQFQFSANVLKVSQLEYYGMLSVMLLVQIPLAAWSGWLVDRGHDRKVMVGGLLGLSLAMGCWAIAAWQPESGQGAGWLLAAYVIWGGFGLVNVAQPSLALKLAPRSDNSIQLSLFKQIGGLVAAIAGIVGGVMIDRYTTAGKLPSREVCMWIFLISGLGRATAALWFLGREPQPLPEDIH